MSYPEIDIGEAIPQGLPGLPLHPKIVLIRQGEIELGTLVATNPLFDRSPSYDFFPLGIPLSYIRLLTIGEAICALNGMHLYRSPSVDGVHR